MADWEGDLLAIASREAGGPLPQGTKDSVRVSIHSHDLWEARDWLAPLLLRRLLDGVITSGQVYIPSGYPAGESGLANLLADLEAESWLDVDDYGEGLIWCLPAAGLEVLGSREAVCRVRGAYTYEVRGTIAP